MNTFATELQNSKRSPLQVPYLHTIGINSALVDISTALDRLDKQPIESQPWPLLDYFPKASFSLGHGNDCLFLKFFVKERWFRASYQQINDPVYRDSCVEFFIAFEKDAPYYNLEFNGLGACLLGYGATREDRELLPEKVIKKVKYGVRLNTDSESEGTITWELCLLIPLTVFCHQPHHFLEGQTCFANFYKCGDDLPFPHYLSWKQVLAPEPNFHLPAFFGQLHFEKAGTIDSLHPITGKELIE